MNTTTTITRTRTRAARKMSTREIARRIKESLVARSGRNWRVTVRDGEIWIKSYSLTKRRELRDLMGLGAVPPAQFRISRPETVIAYLHRAEGYAA
jgi:hypothetical protein